MIWGQIVLIIVLSVVLMKSADVVVRALHQLSSRTSVGAFGLAAVLAAVATSFPELLVGIVAAMEGESVLALGNVVGSNIANLSLIMGVAAMIGGSVGVVGEFLKRDFAMAFLVGALPMLLLLDGNLSRVDGIGLLVVYVMYVLGTFWEQRRYRSKRRGSVWGRIWQRLGNGETDKQLGWVVGGAVVMIVAADLLVQVAGDLANSLGIPAFLMGLFVVAVGTSLPELVFEIEAIRNKEIGMVYGNLLGSVAANSTLILGLTAVISPVRLDNGFRPYLLATIAFVVVFGVFWLLVRTKKRLDRWEGAILVLIYLVFAWLEFSRGRFF